MELSYVLKSKTLLKGNFNVKTNLYFYKFAKNCSINFRKTFSGINSIKISQSEFRKSIGGSIALIDCEDENNAGIYFGSKLGVLVCYMCFKYIYYSSLLTA